MLLNIILLLVITLCIMGLVYNRIERYTLLKNLGKDDDTHVFTINTEEEENSDKYQDHRYRHKRRVDRASVEHD